MYVPPGWTDPVERDEDIFGNPKTDWSANQAL